MSSNSKTTNPRRTQRMGSIVQERVKWRNDVFQYKSNR